MARQSRKTKTPVTDTPAATTTPKTLDERLVAAKALVAKLEREIAAAAIKNDIAIDDAVTFTFGRGDKKRTLTGKIVAMKDDDSQGKLLRVLTGEGFEAETVKINVRDVLTNTTADTRRAAPAGEDPLNVA